MNRTERSASARDEHISPLRLSTYADGETPPEERAEIEAHLNACPACSARLNALRSVSAALTGLSRTSPSAGVWDEVLASARRETRASTAVSRERLGSTRVNGPIRLRNVRLPDMFPARPTTPARRSSRWLMPFPGALSTLAALLLIGLAASLLLRSPLFLTTQIPDVTPTATLAPGDTLNATNHAIAAVARQLAFNPVKPAYLPQGAQFESAEAKTLPSGARYLDVVWTFTAGPVATLHLREQPASAPTDAYTNLASQTTGLAWQVGAYPVWRAMALVERSGVSGVEQVLGDVRLMLDAQPASGASPNDVATALRFTSLSMDVPYSLPRIDVLGPDTSSLLRSIAIVAGAQGQRWTWDVTWSADYNYRRADIIPMSGGPTVREITYAGAGVRLDLSHHRYQILTPPTPNPQTPQSVTQIAFGPNEYLPTGQLWNLGPTTVQIPGRGASMVYDLYRVDSALPEHVYADVSTGAVVAVFVDTRPSAVSPGGPGGAQPYVSNPTDPSAICPPYTVTYTWLVFEPPTQSKSLFNTSPPKGWTQGSVTSPFICGG